MGHRQRSVPRAAPAPPDRTPHPPTPLQEHQPSDPNARQAWQWWKTKKWAMHIAYRLFNRCCLLLGGWALCACSIGLSNGLSVGARGGGERMG